jgi:hypothetical protein
MIGGEHFQGVKLLMVGCVYNIFGNSILAIRRTSKERKRGDCRGYSPGSGRSEHASGWGP